MGLIIYLDGKFVPEEEAKVSVFDHGYLYGDGVFEGIRAYHGRVFKLKEHIDRLYESAKTIMLDIPLSKEEMTEVVVETCRRNNIRDGYIRLVVSRGKGDLGLDPRKCPRPTVMCIAATITLYPQEFYEKGLEVKTVPTPRNLSEACNPRVKSLNYLNNIYAKIEANLAGVLEALMLNAQGYVCEATGDNVFIVKDGELITPPIYLGILKGITRDVVMQLARQRGITVKEEVFTRHDVFNADEVFLTGTAAELIPVIKVDGRVIGDGKPGPMFQQLLQDFRALTEVDGPEIFVPATEKVG
ncbi:MAG: branched-chain-amino-acid transaminase [Bacillota bacterium]|uniref:Branched-chain-amino-acid aminotransferase n=2 Tax=Carboxydocella TaxID=178898 RepID=A0A1T4L8J3_9FIRM|nr:MULTISPECIES: branched-chain-amino-acid transaminase [Carboxydocella]AVX19917.1 branched chain amino acid aminotransferase apoenzyme [Carboxydocella thermautotrophica]AVX30341.1 branched chain amino acid aminotransferase apoenzyme [Carboxydocella thermautotrophica]SJZ50817.1 branched chain amino acid aminotransferase apoenzyme [Carboxydocella sporoproducens DSM 16521]GAW28882.1 branched chain amino acid aminotransferase [Carboxydocella sp. ULO1]GAW30588.1 branched chain amino acid aminotran